MADLGERACGFGEYSDLGDPENGKVPVLLSSRVSGLPLQAILDHLPVGIWFTDSDGRTLYGNPAAKRIWAGARGVGEGGFAQCQAWWEKTGAPVDPDSWASAQAIRTGQTSLNDAIRIRGADGSMRVILNSAVPLHDEEGNVLGAVVVNEDITRQRRTEQALRWARDESERRVRERTAELRRRARQLSRMASQLTLAEQRERRRLAQLLHDHLQQLLVGSLFGLHALTDQTPEPAHGSISQVETLLNEALDASRTLTFELSPPILHEAGLAAALGWLAKWMQEKHGLRVDLHTDGAAHAEREEVQLLLFQSVREALFNVVKHAGVDRACVELRALSDGELRIRVSDQGKGFDTRGLWDHDRDDAGGFGLFSIRERLDLMGGRLEIESSPDAGTTVSLVAPRQREELDATPADTPAVATTPLPRREGRHRRVLLVDDHAVVRRGLLALLRNAEDIEVVGEAATGREALDRARELRPDVVLMDLSMPDMDGVEATGLLRKEHPLVRVIGLSVFDEAGHAEAMLTAGASAYLSKSGRQDVLLKAIRQA